MTLTDKYRKLGGDSPIIIHAQEFFPIPTAKDYGRGYIIRYFTKKLGNDNVIEISKDNYNAVSTIFYQKVEIEWVISGQLNTVRVNGVPQVTGVIELNQKSIKYGESILKGLTLKLINPSQFHKTS